MKTRINVIAVVFFGLLLCNCKGKPGADKVNTQAGPSADPVIQVQDPPTVTTDPEIYELLRYHLSLQDLNGPLMVMEEALPGFDSTALAYMAQEGPVQRYPDAPLRAAGGPRNVISPKDAEGMAKQAQWNASFSWDTRKLAAGKATHKGYAYSVPQFNSEHTAAVMYMCFMVDNTPLYAESYLLRKVDGRWTVSDTFGQIEY